jgi:regulator of cell morphogenesis and NO signaling
MNIIANNTTIGTVVAAIPESKELFKRFGIDYCCGGGHRLLEEVIEKQNLNPAEIYEELTRLAENNTEKVDRQNPETLSAGDLTVFIENKHHRFLRQALPEATDLLYTLLIVHGSKHRELFSVYRLFGKLKAELEQHLLKEELLLFPEINAAENDDKIKALSQEIINEHEGAGEILSELKAITDNYTPPADGCETYRKAFALLEGIDRDLHEHIHLENNILLKNYDNRQH